MIMEKTDVEGVYKREDGVFVNRSNDKLKAYRRQKQHMREMKQQSERIDRMEEKMDLILELLGEKNG